MAIAQVDREEMVNRLVTEGKQIGKVPWCCDGIAECAAARRLLYGHGIEGRETMDETVARRAKHDKRYRAVQLRLEQEKHGS